MLKRSLNSERWAYSAIVLFVLLAAVFVSVYIGNEKGIDVPDSISKAKISKVQTTVLKSLDGLAILVIPQNTASDAQEISIARVQNPEIDSENRVSEIYKFGP